MILMAIMIFWVGKPVSLCRIPVLGDVLRVGRCVGLASLTLFAFGISDTLASFMLSLEQSLN